MASKQTGRIKAGLGTLIGNAGEYYVMAELLKREVIAGLAPRNAPGFDILATYEGKTALIRVKTKREIHEPWQWRINKNSGEIFKNLTDEGDFTVLVNLAMDVKNMHYFVFRTRTINQLLRDIFNQWVSTPGKNGRPRNPDNPHRGLSYKECEEILLPNEDRLDLLWE